MLLSLSLVDTQQTDHRPHLAAIALWLGLLFFTAVGLGRRRAGLAAGPALGLAAGLFFAGGDISAKLVVYGGLWLVAAVSLVVFYAIGTSVLQGSFQHTDALTGAGLATLATNAVPIAAGFVVFGEQLPHGTKGALQLAAFALLVVSAALLAQVARGKKSEGGGNVLEALQMHSRRLPAAGHGSSPTGGHRRRRHRQRATRAHPEAKQ